MSRRNRLLTVRMNDSEWDLLERLASAAGASMSDYVRAGIGAGRLRDEPALSTSQLQLES